MLSTMNVHLTKLSSSPPQLTQLGNITDSNWGYRILLAIHTRDLDALIQIQNLESFNKIKTNGEFGMGQALLAEIKHLIRLHEEYLGEFSTSFLEILMTHPKINEISDDVPVAPSIERKGSQTYEDDTLGFSLSDEIEQGENKNISTHLGILMRLAVTKGSDESISIVEKLLSSQISHLIVSNGPFGLGRVLAHAAFHSNGDFIDAILEHPRAKFITSDSINIPFYRTKLESGLPKSHQFQYGIAEAIIFALQNNDTNEAKGNAEMLLEFAYNNEINLSSSSLQTASEIATSNNYDRIVKQIEKFLDE